MKKNIARMIAAVVLLSIMASCQSNSAEIQKKWTYLFNGKDTSAWRSLGSDKFPEKGWYIQDEVLVRDPNQGSPGDIITKEQYSNFELEFEFKLTQGANSGVKYFIVSDSKSAKNVGPEFQILDDANHPDAKAGKGGNRTIGSLYDLIPAAKDKLVKPIDEWNVGRIVSRDMKVEHWLNGKKIVEYKRDDPAFRAIVAGSKFKDIKDFALAEKGHILLQDHGNKVFFRNIKIRVL